MREVLQWWLLNSKAYNKYFLTLTACTWIRSNLYLYWHYANFIIVKLYIIVIIKYYQFVLCNECYTSISHHSARFCICTPTIKCVDYLIEDIKKDTELIFLGIWIIALCTNTCRHYAVLCIQKKILLYVIYHFI